nr:S41 family peptidase [Thiohalocapsa marina]
MNRTNRLLLSCALLTLLSSPVHADGPAPESAPESTTAPESAPKSQAPVLRPHQPPAPLPPPAWDTPAPEPAADSASEPASDPAPESVPVPDAPTDMPPGAAPDAESAPEATPEEAAPDAMAPDGADTAQAPEGLPLDALRTFAEVFGRIKSGYVEAVDDRALLSSAIRGMLGGLDPHSAYLDQDEYRDLRVGTSGEFGGLGIEVGMEDGFIKVIAPIDDTPAQRAGIQAGDLIVRIDGKPVKGLSLSEAVKLMRGKPGTGITLTVVREDEGNPLSIEIVRDVIKVASVKSRTLEPGFGYIRISNFQARTTEDVLDAVATLKRDNPNGLEGVVLDLRNNPGGVLNAAVGVSDAFLERGLIVYTEGRIDDSRLEFKAGPDDVLDAAPLVVLVNGGSASASEIVAGALQDQGRAIVMGRTTFGKGSVQTIVPIDERTALKLTTARYYTPSGRSIQAQGIVPDIELARGSLTLDEADAVAPLTEADLRRHLPDADQDAETGAADDAAEDTGAADDDAERIAAEDYQLSEALNVLKGLSLYRRAGRP